MLVECLAPIASVCGVGVILNAILLVFLFKEQNSSALKSILISISCSNIALSLVLASRSTIPFYLKDNASTSFAAFTFGIYCNMINIFIITAERMMVIFCFNTNNCCTKKSFCLIVIALFWIACIPMAVTLGVFDLYDGIATYVESKIVPITFAAIALLSILLHLTMCCRMHFKLQKEITCRRARSIGHGVVVTSKKGLALRHEYRNVGLSFGLVISYTLFTYPYMLHSFLNLEKRIYCHSSSIDLYTSLVVILAVKTVIDPLICICITICIPRYWEKARKNENESST